VREKAKKEVKEREKEDTSQLEVVVFLRGFPVICAFVVDVVASALFAAAEAWALVGCGVRGFMGLGVACVVSVLRD